jgi:CRP-like cAMP-binding protein
MKNYLIEKLKPETKIRFQYLYKEGEPADKVYLVKEGQFLVTKKLVYLGGKEPVAAVSHLKHQGNTGGKHVMQRIEGEP